MSSSSREGVRQIILVLTTINVYQPISRDELAEAVETYIDSSALTELLDWLVSRQLVKRLPEDRYRVTWQGMNIYAGLQARHQRDIDRMHYLAELASEVRGPQRGDDSSSMEA